MHARKPQMDLAAPADWLTALLREPAESQRVASGGSEVELLIWGQGGLPGLFLLHGAGAHAHWWAGVAPMLARPYRVAAILLPGHGASGWRDRYSCAAFWQENGSAQCRQRTCQIVYITVGDHHTTHNTPPDHTLSNNSIQLLP